MCNKLHTLRLLYITNPKTNGKKPIKLATTERSDTKRFNNAYQNANNDSTSYNEQPEQIEQPNDLIGEIPTEPYEDFNGSDDVNKNTLPENQNNAPTDGNKNEQPENQEDPSTDDNNSKAGTNWVLVYIKDDYSSDDDSNHNTDTATDSTNEHQNNTSHPQNLPENADNNAGTDEVPLPQAESLPQDASVDWVDIASDFIPIYGDIKSFAEAQTGLDYAIAAAGVFLKPVKAIKAADKIGDAAKAAKKVGKAENYNSAGSKSVGQVDCCNTSTTKPPKTSEPNSVSQHVDTDGRIKQERYYDKNGNAYLDIDYNDHNKPWDHPYVPHEHSIDSSNGGFVREKTGRPINK